MVVVVLAGAGDWWCLNMVIIDEVVPKYPARTTSSSRPLTSPAFRRRRVSWTGPRSMMVHERNRQSDSSTVISVPTSRARDRGTYRPRNRGLRRSNLGNRVVDP